MAEIDNFRRGVPSRGFPLDLKSVTRITAVLVFGFVTGCSAVPDAANPVEWYKSASDVLTGGDTAGQAKAPTDGLVADNAAPKAKSPASAQPGGKTSGGLPASGETQEYASAPIPRQSAPSSVLNEAPPAAQPPVPAAQPVISVTPAPIAPPPSAKPATQMAQVGQKPSQGRSQGNSMTPSDMNQLTRDSATTPPVAPSVPLSPPATSLPSASAGNEYGTVVIDGESAGSGARPAAKMSDRQFAELTAPGASSQGTVVISSEGVDTENVTEPTGIAMPRKGKLIFPSSGGAEKNGPARKASEKSGNLKVASILFANGSARLDARDVSILRAVRELQAERGGTLRVVGHASSRTADMTPIHHKMLNFRISVERADRVARELVTLGVPKDAVQVVAVSDTDPLYYEVMPSGEAGNRRAEIFLVK